MTTVANPVVEPRSTRHSGTHAGICRVCGDAATRGSCACARCQAPFHADCFTYAGGCSIFGCGSVRAHFDGPAPDGWRRDNSGEPGWLLPADAIPREGARPWRPAGPAARCMEYWTSCGVMEAISLAGQTWFAGFSAAAFLSGLWSGPAVLGVATAIVFVSHVHSLAALVALGWSLTGPKRSASSEETAFRKLAAMRLGAIRRSRALLVLALFAGAGAATESIAGVQAEPHWVHWIVFAVVVFPWFSLAPRWKLEEPLLAKLAGQL